MKSVINWRDPKKEMPPRRSKLLILVKTNRFHSGYQIVTGCYDDCPNGLHEHFAKDNFRTECGCYCCCEGNDWGECIKLELVEGWLVLESLEPNYENDN